MLLSVIILCFLFRSIVFIQFFIIFAIVVFSERGISEFRNVPKFWLFSFLLIIYFYSNYSLLFVQLKYLYCMRYFTFWTFIVFLVFNRVKKSHDASVHPTIRMPETERISTPDVPFGSVHTLSVLSDTLTHSRPTGNSNQYSSPCAPDTWIILVTHCFYFYWI